MHRFLKNRFCWICRPTTLLPLLSTRNTSSIFPHEKSMYATFVDPAMLCRGRYTTTIVWLCSSKNCVKCMAVFPNLSSRWKIMPISWCDMLVILKKTRWSGTGSCASAGWSSRCFAFRMSCENSCEDRLDDRKRLKQSTALLRNVVTSWILTDNWRQLLLLAYAFDDNLATLKHKFIQAVEPGTADKGQPFCSSSQSSVQASPWDEVHVRCSTADII